MACERPVVIAGGGTGGHVFPGLALAEEMRRRRPGRPVHWIGTVGGVEERLVPESGIPLTLLPLAGVARRGLLRGLSAGWLAAAATLRLVVRFARVRPALTIGVGGFASGPAVLAALLLGVPTLLLEQNAIPGRTNRALSLFTGAVAVSFAGSEAYLKGRSVLTGNPVRRSIAELAPRTRGPLRTLLSFGGSRGARALNEAWIGALPRLGGLGIAFTLQTGDHDRERVAAAAAGCGASARVEAFLDDLPERLAAADLVVARAGATTVAELTAGGVPSILVPYPYAADDHQRANARALSAAGAALVIDPDELTADRLAGAVRSLAEDPARLTKMGRSAAALGRPEAAALVADLADRLTEGAS